MTSNTIATSAMAGLAVGTGVVTSLNQNQSLLNSTIDQIITGNYTLYLSDIVSMAGVLLGAASLGVAVYKIITGR